jgi:hypothetical protein
MLTSGTILIEKDALRPACFQLEDAAGPNAWMPVTHHLTPHQLEAELAATGWNFFYMAHAIRTTAFGLNRANMIGAALQRVITNVRRQRCNCLEVDDVSMHSFLGLPYVSVSAHPRHIQKGAVFAGL